MTAANALDAAAAAELGSSREAAESPQLTVCVRTKSQSANPGSSQRCPD
jgi:hypothetical protein